MLETGSRLSRPQTSGDGGQPWNTMSESTSLWNSRAFALWAKVASEPEALVYFFKELGFPVNRIGFEAGPLSQWLHAGLTQAGFETVLLETWHVKAALSAMTVKTDRKDACGLAQLLRMGWFQQVHAKSI